MVDNWIPSDACPVQDRQSSLDLKYLDDNEFSDYVECLLKDSLTSKDPRTHSVRQPDAFL